MHLYDLLMDSIGHLLPGVSLKLLPKEHGYSPAEHGFILEKGHVRVGACRYKDRHEVWYDLRNTEAFSIQVERLEIGLTRVENRVLDVVPFVLQGLIPRDPRSVGQTQKIGLKLGFEHAIVAKYLRRRKTGKYWLPAFVLFLLQELTYQRYEGKRCSSGFVYTSQLDLFRAELDTEEYSFHPFEVPFKPTSAFFRDPASYRYIDGRNSFYVADNWGVHGTLSIRDPRKYSFLDRMNQSHLLKLVDDMPGRVFASYVGENGDVRILANDCQFQWVRNHWRVFDPQILDGVLERFGLSSEISTMIVALARTLSELRYASLILIPHDEGRLPTVLKNISGSKVGASLAGQVRGSTLFSLLSNHRALGVFSSDGISTVSKAGVLLSCGDIIDSSSASGREASGASGSQAAMAASQFGLAIKVSQDGPVSVFLDQRKLVTFN